MKKELENAKITLWDTYTESTPDAILESDSFLVFFESKVDQAVSVDQLRREYSDGISQKKNFYLVCITKNFEEPSEISEVRGELRTKNILWTSWQSLYAILPRIRKSKQLDPISEKLIKNLEVLFESKRLRGFSRFRIDDYEKIVDSYETVKSLFSEVSIFVNELSSIIAKDGIVPKRTGGTAFDRDGRGTRLDDPKEWVTSHLTFAFGEEDWPFSRFWRENYLFLRFLLWKREMWVGYRLRADDPAQKKVITSSQRKLVDYLKENKDLTVVFDWLKEYSAEDVDHENFEEANIDYDIVEFVHKIPIIESRRLHACASPFLVAVNTKW